MATSSTRASQLELPSNSGTPSTKVRLATRWMLLMLSPHISEPTARPAEHPILQLGCEQLLPTKYGRGITARGNDLPRSGAAWWLISFTGLTDGFDRGRSAGREGLVTRISPHSALLLPTGSIHNRSGKSRNSVPAGGTLRWCTALQWVVHCNRRVVRESQRFPCCFRVGFRCGAGAARARIRPTGTFRQGHRSANGSRPCHQAIQGSG